MRILYYTADWRSVAFVAATLAGYAAVWLGAVHPLWMIGCMGLAFIGCVINHNHQHHRTFVARWLDSAFGVLITLAIGVPASAIVAMHILNHHVHNNGDEDHVRVAIVNFRWRWLNLLLFPFVAIARFVPDKSRVLKAWKQSRPRLYRQLMLERVVLYTVLIALLILRPLETLLYVGLPYVFGQWGILAINHVQHVGCEADSPFGHSRNFVGWSNWFFFNNGFHTAHHLRPGMHWSRLPALHRQIEPHIDPRLNCRSLAWALLELYVLPRGFTSGGMLSRAAGDHEGCSTTGSHVHPLRVRTWHPVSEPGRNSTTHRYGEK